MNILLVYPQYPDSFWGFKHALRFISRKAAVPPLGLLTVSAMLPGSWNKRLIDMNVSPLNSSDLQWADYVFLSAMYIQKHSVEKVIEMCQAMHVKIVAGGPLFTQEFNNYLQIDHLILNEAEITLPPFLKDLEAGITPEKIYSTPHFADISLSPVPDYHLLSLNDYAFMNMQVTRGCPYACDFCEITSLLGHKVRMKSTEQVLNELEELYRLKWRGPVSIVDDNFIGNTKEVKHNLLPAMNQWVREHKYPFTFSTQTSINLADDEEMLSLMTQTGFTSTFIGIETPEAASLNECNKVQNKNRDLLQSVKQLHRAGMQVSGGFIVGFDSDSPSVFQRQIDFIQESGIATAMVGLLNAPKNTKLYKRLEAENRLTDQATGNNTDFSLNFIPKMKQSELIEGYESVIRNIYTPKAYYKRVRKFLLDYRRRYVSKNRITFRHIKALLKTFVVIGIMKKGRLEYWKFLLWTIYKRPSLFVEALTYTVYGYHFRTIFGINKNI
jgi:radical SAM superfamily enzyme YgiQ (UPF0313 family)